MDFLSTKFESTKVELFHLPKIVAYVLRFYFVLKCARKASSQYSQELQDKFSSTVSNAVKAIFNESRLLDHDRYCVNIIM